MLVSRLLRSLGQGVRAKGFNFTPICLERSSNWPSDVISLKLITLQKYHTCVRLVGLPQHCLSISTNVERRDIYKDSVSDNISIEKLYRMGNLLEAVQLMSDLHERGADISLETYNMLLNSAAEANDFNLVSKVFKYLLLSRNYPNSNSYINVAMAFLKVEDLEIILNFIRDISEITRDREPTVMNRIIFATGNSGQIDKAMFIFEQLKKLNLKIDVSTFSTILDFLGKAGRVDQMLTEFKNMKDMGYSPDVVTYSSVTNCLRRLGKFDLCAEFTREMLERGFKMDLRTYTALIDSFGRAGHINIALDLFEEMKKSHQPSVYVFRALIDILKKAGFSELAMKIYGEMETDSSKLVSHKDFDANTESGRGKMKR